MLFRSGRHWTRTLFERCGWLIRRRPTLRRRTAWNWPARVAAECQLLEQRTLLSSITVTSLADTLGAGNGVTLRDAIQAANTDTSVDGSVAGQAGIQNVIVFQAGLNGRIALTNGELTISSSLKIQGLGAANTTIDAQHNSRIFDVTSTAGDVTLDGMTLENGRTTDNGSAFISSPGTGEGGAVRSVSTGTLIVANSSLTGNSTAGTYAFGGALYSSGAMTVTNCSLTANFTTAADAAGGAVSSDGMLIVANSSLSANSTAGGNADGGAIDSRGTLRVLSSTISGNASMGNFAYGGAIAADGNAAVTNSTIAGNFTIGNYAYGGGIAGNDLTVTNSTIVQNQATHSAGGGIRGFKAGPTLTLRNTILAQNTDNGTAPDLDPGTGAKLTITHSLIGDNTGTSLAAAPVGSPDANGNLVGTHAAPINPRLGSLANNGGMTQTMALQVGSPAIEGGSNAQSTDPGPDGIAGTADDVALTTDQRGSGFERVLGTVDMGAYEIQPIFAGEYAVATSGSNTVTLASVTQTSGAQITLNGSTTANAAIASSSQLQIGGVTATYGNSQITFGSSGPFANQVWTKLDLPTNFTNQSGAPVQVIENGNSITFVNKFGATTPASWTSPTTLFLSAWNESVTTGIGTLTFQDGSIWSENLVLNGTNNGAGTTTIAAAPTMLYDFDYVNGSGKPVHLIQTGTNNVIFIFANNVFGVGTFISATQLTTPVAPNDIATISNDFSTLTWQDGTVWTQTALTGAVSLTNATNSNGVPTHLIQNGSSQVAFVDALGRITIGNEVSPGKFVTDLYGPGDAATISGNTVTWQDGTVWNPTGGSVPPTITFTDSNGAAFHVKLTSANTLVGLDGEMAGVTATRQNSQLLWSNGAVWSGFDLNALNALFEMGIGYP